MERSTWLVADEFALDTLRREVFCLHFFAVELALVLSSDDPSPAMRLISLIRGAHSVLLLDDADVADADTKHAHAVVLNLLHQYRENSDDAYRAITGAKGYAPESPFLHDRVNTYHHQWREAAMAFKDPARADRSVATAFAAHLGPKYAVVNTLKATITLGSMREAAGNLLTSYRVTQW